MASLSIKRLLQQLARKVLGSYAVDENSFLSSGVFPVDFKAVSIRFYQAFRGFFRYEELGLIPVSFEDAVPDDKFALFIG